MIREFADLAVRVFDKKITPKITEQYRFGDTRHIFSDISKLKYSGWKPVHRVEDSITAYAEWLKQLDEIDNVLDHAEQQMKSLNVVRPKQRLHERRNMVAVA